MYRFFDELTSNYKVMKHLTLYQFTKFLGGIQGIFITENVQNINWV